MNLTDDKVIGIVGGMGPQSGLALFNSVLCQTNAITDQEHLSIILMSFPQYIPDRTLFLDGTLEYNPAFNIVKVIKNLEKAGAKIVGMACNTSHAPKIFNVILEQLEKTESHVKLLNMPYETCKFIKENIKDALRVGLMTTNGTYKSGIYSDLLQKWGYEVIVPDFDFQNEVIHRMIYDPKFGIKSNPNGISKEVKILRDEALQFFKDNQADVVVLGCTELSLILNDKMREGITIVDSTNVMARALVREATIQNAIDVFDISLFDAQLLKS